MRDRSSDGEARRSGFCPSKKAGLAKLACGAVVAVGAFWISLAVAPGMNGVAGTALAGITLAIAVVDYRKMIIPDELNASALVVGLGAAGLNSSGAPFGPIQEAVVRAAAMFAVFFAFRSLYRRLRGVEGMGLGDVKLAAAAGAWLDWPLLPLAVDFAALAALAVVVLASLQGRKPALTAKVAFGVYFAPSIWVCWALAAWWRYSPV
jgi:leader peptidase (prepilin peptidase) / N-methyltransferase